MIPKPKSPCCGCMERTSECHAKCERYLAYEKQKSEYYDARNTEIQGVPVHYDMYRKYHERLLAHKRGRHHL